MSKKIVINEEQSRFIVNNMLNESAYDMSEVGEIECSLDFDNDAYEEYLTGNGLTDSVESKMNFIRDYDIEYDVELKDPETYHTFDYERMTINDIEQNFGSTIANDVLQDCMDGRSHRYELALYDNESVDVTNPEALSNAAMQRLKSGGYTKDCRGFILPNGVVVYTGSEHNMCTQIPCVNGTYHFIELGCIRLLDHSVDLAQAPTPKQMQTLQQVFDAYYGDTLYLDLMNKKIGQASKKYQELYPEDAFRDINNYFSYGIKPKQGIYENIDELDLYHGTNADFNQFSEDFFLSGVGEMAMGWGVYLTNSLNTAKAYSPGGQVMTVQVSDGKYLDGKRIRKAEAMDIARKFYKYYLSTEYGKSAYGNCQQEFWDYECSGIANCPDGSYLYGTVATLLGDDKEASKWLHSIGYAGLRFYSTNVNTGEKSVNYVIFDTKDVKIIKKQQTDSLNESVNEVRGITKLDICNGTMSVIERRNGVELSDEGKKWFIGLMNGAKFGVTMDMILEKAAFSILNIPSFPVGQSVGNEWDELDGILRIVIQKTGVGNDILQRLRALKFGQDRKIISDGEWSALEIALQYYPDIFKELKRCYNNFAVIAPVIYKTVDYLKKYKDGTAALEFCYLVGYQREHARASLDVAVNQVLQGVGRHLLPQFTSKK